ncbi:hypothetical protein JS530_01140 [Bifidobacterium sp. LC6]|uniref:Uncharacterized protein n=1 Tax=Bifidobacterium colobi TaxID=2809026 RepID=A0ABS5UUK3_9BIFI|nr:hypothetical protein [Bifidobacterium colobi]MBT1174133.1 hypothetical protein [Bifidobacterium colobi]
MSIEMAPRWREAAGKFIADGAGTVSMNAKRIGANAVDLGSKAGKAITSGAQHVGQEAKQLRDNIVHAKSEPPQTEAQ